MAKVTIVVEDCEGDELVRVRMEYDPPIPGAVAAADLTCAQLLGLQFMQDYGIQPQKTTVQ